MRKHSYRWLLTNIVGSFFVNGQNRQLCCRPEHSEGSNLCQLTIRLGQMLGLVIFSFALCIPLSVEAANSDIVINEIGAYPTSTHEWVEIYNRGTDPVTIDTGNWKFWSNNSAHNLSLSQGSNTIAPGEYAIICQNDTVFKNDYPTYSGTLFDSAWSDLSAQSSNNWKMGLKDTSATFSEPEFTYLATNNFSLERRDPTLTDYTSANWQEHLSSNTVGAQNSNFGSGLIATTTPTTTAITLTIITDPNAPIKINETYPNPNTGESEWVELYNPTSDNIDLTGYTLCDNRSSSCTIASLTGSIGAQSFLQITMNGNHLNNDGDSVILLNPTGSAIDQLSYDDDLTPSRGASIMRKVDGQDTDNDTADWTVTTSPTPASTNVLSIPASVTAQNIGTSATSQPITDVTPETPLPIVPSTLRLSELLPDPVGRDSGNEFIEIENTGSSLVDLTGWKIMVGNTTKPIEGFVFAGNFLALFSSSTKLTLPNTSGIVKLLNGYGQVVSSVSYKDTKPGTSYSFDGSAWHWSTLPTPNAKNSIEAIDPVQIIWKIKTPSDLLPGEIGTFSAAGSADPRGGYFFPTWQFSDGVSLDGMSVARSFTSSGVYTGAVRATSSAGTVGLETFTLLIGRNSFARPVIISEVLANPDGSDDGEYITLYNPATTTVNLTGWHLENAGGKKYEFPAKTSIPAGGHLIFYRAVTKIALNNSADTVKLFSADKLIDQLTIAKSKSGEVKLASASSTGQVLGEKIFASSTKSVGAFLTIATAAAAKKGTIATLRGTVTALPGAFGKQVFYLSDDTGGMLIYQNKANFPKLELGTLVSVTGRLSTRSNVPDLVIPGPTAIRILGTSIITPETIAVGDLGDELLGHVVTLAGTITEKTKSYLYLDDGEAEIKVVFKTGTTIDGTKFALNEKITATGILMQGKEGYELWPRSTQDLATEEATAKVGAEKNPTSKTIPITAGGMALVSSGYLFRRKILSVGATLARKVLK